MSKVFLVFYLLTFVCFSSCARSLPKDQAEFFSNLRKLCGKSFEGIAVDPRPAPEPFDQLLVMHVDQCRRNEIRIPLHVGENRSRTWIISRTRDGLLFKHDHRHEDGTPEDLTMYGGISDGNGTAFMQSFPADDDTKDMLRPELEPLESEHVWSLRLSDDMRSFSYILERGHNNTRFQADFDLTRDVR